jgi:maltokinase
MTSTFDLVHTAAGDKLRKHLAALLVDWLPQQRWFGGKGIGIDSVTIESFQRLFDGYPAPSADEPTVWHMLVRARLRTAVGETPEIHTYQLFLGVRPGPLPHSLTHAAIGAPGEVVSELGGVCYDALHDAGITTRLMDGVAERQSFGLLRFDRPTGPEPVRDLRPRMLTTEQSNTSLVFGDRYIAKVLRRPTAGLNPDLELVTALAEVGSPHIARPVGWLELGRSDDPDPMTLIVVQEFLKSATDGWGLALASVRDLYADPKLPPARAGADFAPEAYRLGEATARVHQDLATALPTGRLDAQESAALAAAMTERLEQTASRVPALRPHTAALRTALSQVATAHVGQQVQRVHGDYHLGQVVRTIHGWILLDFEGEPIKPLEERRAMTSALKDVAGMLRSFDYAAHHQLTIAVPDGAESSMMPLRAAEWAERNREAFCAGYASAAETDPREQMALLRAFEIDKAVYEVAYEAANRPSWLQIPLAACARLAAAGCE